MQNISGYGLIVNITADKTLPIGYPITQFADDADPLDFPSLQIADKAMGLNGDMIVWSKANTIIMTLNIIPGGADDAILSLILEANRVGKGKLSANDVIGATIIYQGLQTLQVARTVSFTKGVITDGLPAIGVASSGREKTRIFTFAFENKTGT